jgi:type IV pilus assembly protein PilC
VNLLESVQLVRGVTNNVLWAKLWSDVEEAMTAGRPVSNIMLESSLIPPPVAQMIAAGENTGRLPDVLNRVATSSEEDLETAVKTATQLIEPALIVFMGITIGGIALALLLPIFTIANIMTKN